MTVDIASLVSDNLDIWTTAVERKSGAGRGGGRRTKMRGIELLRSLILDLAVRGRLLPQDKSDQPAAKMVEQARIGLRDSAATIGRQRWKPSKPFTEAERKCPLPSGWALARVNDTGFYINGLAFKPSDWGTMGRPIIRIQNLTNPSTPFNYATGEFPDEVVVRDGDILVSWSATLATFQWRGDDAILNQHIFRVIPADGVTDKAYLRLILEQAIKDLAAGEHAHGLVMAHINRGPFLDHIVLIPPLVEQQRIVAKVDELMALCEALEVESAAAMAAHQALVEALLATLTASTDAADLATSWARLEAHFDTLFTTEASVDALKQTILDLAVRGKLVAHDAPNSWTTSSLDNLIGPMDSGWSPACLEFAARNDETWGVLKTTAVQFLNYQPEQNKELPQKLTPRPAAECKGGDILITRAGPTNRVGICCYVASTRSRLMISDKIVRFRPASDAISGAYLALALSVGPAAAQIEQAKSGMAASQVNISQAKLRSIKLVIPPLDEQTRIIAKVDQLMALCDALKSRVTDAAATQKHLADAITERVAA